MEEGDSFLMTIVDRKRLCIVRQILDKRITQEKGAVVLRLSTRQIKRMCQRVKREGDGGVIHRNRGRSSNRRIKDSVKKEIVEMMAWQYKGFGPTLISEQLKKQKKIQISEETIRLWLIESNLPYRRRKVRPHREWRERKSHFGEMLQMDGSHHDWLEGRGPRMVMMGYVDDATGRTFARFYEYEGTLPAFDGLLRYFKKYGLPCSIYLDKHTTYKGIRRLSVLDQLEGEPGTSQFQRAMKELGVEVIHANSPQAKGRIERFFRTAQDRLVKLMRLSRVSTLDQANTFLSDYLGSHNQKFSRPAAEEADLHREMPPVNDLKSILSIQTRRFVRNDFTVSHNGTLYQIENHINKRQITIEQRIDGSVHLMNGKRQLKFHPIQKQPKTKAPNAMIVGSGNRLPRPPVAENHPWRNFRFGSHDPAKGDSSNLVRR